MKPGSSAAVVTAQLLASMLTIGVAASHASAKGKPDDDAGDDVKVDDVKVDDNDDDQAAKPGKSKSKPKSNDGSSGGKLEKQDLSGHDLGTTKKENVFERDRFFVDKTDTTKTEKGTLVQGSITSTSFGYHEAGGTLAVPTGSTAVVPSASQFNRLFTDLRLQTDLRHLSAGRWDARVDVRGRVVTDPGIVTTGFTPASNSTVQSGFLGKNELEVKELWLLRNGARSDLFFGRQFIPEIGRAHV